MFFLFETVLVFELRTNTETYVGRTLGTVAILAQDTRVSLVVPFVPTRLIAMSIHTELVGAGTSSSPPGIADAAAFKAWKPASFKDKRAEFQRQTKSLSPQEVQALNLKEYFDATHIRQLWNDFNRKTVPACSQATKVVIAEAKKPKSDTSLKQPNKVKMRY